MKVGDWVTNTEGFLFRVTENNMYASDDFTLWQPKEGEWVIQKINENSFQVFKFNPYFNYTDDVEPFIGELPSFIKDK